jgi:hypothetical protein
VESLTIMSMGFGDFPQSCSKIVGQYIDLATATSFKILSSFSLKIEPMMRRVIISITEELLNVLPPQNIIFFIRNAGVAYFV